MDIPFSEIPFLTVYTYPSCYNKQPPAIFFEVYSIHLLEMPVLLIND